jgi:hypothetical protein
LRRGRTSGGWHGRGHNGGVEVGVVRAHSWCRPVIVVKIVGVVMMMMMMMMMMTMTVRATMTTVEVEVFMRRLFSLFWRRLIDLLRCEIIAFFETAGQWGDGEVRSRNRFWDWDRSGRGTREIERVQTIRSCRGRRSRACRRRTDGRRRGGGRRRIISRGSRCQIAQGRQRNGCGVS